jgi:hypothetical protein
MVLQLFSVRCATYFGFSKPLSGTCMYMLKKIIYNPKLIYKIKVPFFYINVQQQYYTLFNTADSLKRKRYYP